MRRNYTLLAALGGLMAAAGLMPAPDVSRYPSTPSAADVRRASKAASVRVLPPTPEQKRQAAVRQARKVAGGKSRSWPAYMTHRKAYSCCS